MDNKEERRCLGLPCRFLCYIVGLVLVSDFGAVDSNLHFVALKKEKCAVCVSNNGDQRTKSDPTCIEVCSEDAQYMRSKQRDGENECSHCVSIGAADQGAGHWKILSNNSEFKPTF